MRLYADRHKIDPITANFRPKPERFVMLNHLPTFIKISQNKYNISYASFRVSLSVVIRSLLLCTYSSSFYSFHATV